ncbi:BRO-N domain-containing protein [Pontibaca salina]|uniref:Bro-N domain-containing protein n=1 Tax=Pontibaca salina TaxID=2795731 RepID=A0A934HKV2_9RHOB|nr:hypothetical protein [Pontibaca salina]
MSASSVRLFRYREKILRAITIDNEPWFVGRDVCDLLGLTAGQTFNNLRGLTASEKRYVSRSELTGSMIAFPNRGAYCITITGLHEMIKRNRRRSTESIQLWIIQEVLPGLRASVCNYKYLVS